MKTISILKSFSIHTPIIACAVFLASCGYEQKPEGSKEIAEERNEAKSENSKKEKDAQFLVNAAEINLEQIKLGELASRKGSTSHVKELGQNMEEAHSKSFSDLRALAEEKRMSIPKSATSDANDSYMDLNGKSAKDFDKAYAVKMVSSHKSAISTFEKASKDCDDKDVKNWAISTLPELRRHLNLAIECQEKCEEK